MRWWLLILWLGLVGGLGCALSSAWAQAVCPVPSNLPPLRIDVRVVEPKIVYHHDVDLFGLQKLGNSSERPPRGAIRLGVTFNPHGFISDFSHADVPLPDGHVCVWVVNLTMVLGEPQMDVYVAADYATDTCQYKVILNHENTHVRFNLETLRDWQPSVKAALVDTVRHRFPMIFPGKPDEKVLSAQVYDNMDAVFRLMSEDMRKRNATIDTIENYRFEHSRCSNWSRGNYSLD